jgi:hypothetical protein
VGHEIEIVDYLLSIGMADAQVQEVFAGALAWAELFLKS